jgi:hypothetical protein
MRKKRERRPVPFQTDWYPTAHPSCAPLWAHVYILHGRVQRQTNADGHHHHPNARQKTSKQSSFPLPLLQKGGEIAITSFAVMQPCDRLRQIAFFFFFLLPNQFTFSHPR